MFFREFLDNAYNYINYIIIKIGQLGTFNHVFSFQLCDKKSYGKSKIRILYFHQHSFIFQIYMI